MVEIGGAPIYSCRNCRNPLAYAEDLASKSYKAKSGPAYLFYHAMNVVIGAKEDKMLITGLFSIAPIYCSKCGVELGWKYIQAYERSQRFKEGNFILEKLKIIEEFA